MDDGKKKSASNFQMLQKLDKEVTSKRKDFKDSRYSDERRRRRSRSVSPFDGRKKRRSASPNDSAKKKKKDKEGDNFDYDIPDRSYGDLYCKVCDSHMNSEQMWEAHIQGKRHLKHSKHIETDTKYETLSLEDPLFLQDIKDTKHLIIGLKQCCELRRLEGKPTYQCFLCSANLPNTSQFIEHLIGLKHRLAYLKEHDPQKHELISKAELKKGMIEPVVEECIQQHFAKYGHGKMQVKKERPKPPDPYKKTYAQDYKKKKDDRKPSPVRRSPPSKSRDSYYEDSDFRDYQHQPPRGESYNDKRFYSPEKDPYYGADDYGFRPITRARSITPPRLKDPNYYANSSQSQQTNMYDKTSPSWPQTMDYASGGDLRAVLDQRKAQDMNKSQELLKAQELYKAQELQKAQELTIAQNTASSTNVYESLKNVIDALPTMLFFELVVRKLETIDPNDEEINMLQQIGNRMIAIVMTRKLNKLPPDLLNKYKETVGGTSSPASSMEKQSTPNIPNSLTNLISYFKSSKENSNNNASDSKNLLADSGSTYVTPSGSSFFSPPHKGALFPPPSTGALFPPPSTGAVFPPPSTRPAFLSSSSNAVNIPGLSFNEQRENNFSTINSSSSISYPTRNLRDHNLRYLQ